MIYYGQNSLNYLIANLANTNARITNYDRWLCVNDEKSLVTVYERKPYAKKTTTVYEGDSLTRALEVLFFEED